jgi:hypothetical protein
MCYQPPGTGICVTFSHLWWGDASRQVPRFKAARNPTFRGLIVGAAAMGAAVYGIRSMYNPQTSADLEFNI